MAQARRTVRCAIYTRKSSEDGLEQSFNSLDAQREACTAFIASQKHEGWIALPALYDDGGLSGGTLERPALKRLLVDIATGLVDAVVVYKVDRLTRSLGDFAKIVEAFDAKGVSFVAVTQQFNTTSSMGRLTLNMLLSFAQFEREVTAERIRDKIAASKQKGLWMGGLPPLGYDVQDKQLVVNDAEAAVVRSIYQRYLELSSVRALQDELVQAGIRSKRRVDRFGRVTGGKPLARGALYLMLQNRLYRGLIVHQGQSYPGRHRPIIDEPLWQQVQQMLTTNRVERRSRAKAAQQSLLAGLVFDESGERLVPSHANKRGLRYRYYVSQPLIKRGRAAAANGIRCPAGDLEQLVERRVIDFLQDHGAIHDAIAAQVLVVEQRQALLERAAALAVSWPSLPPASRRTLLAAIVPRIELQREQVLLQLRPDALVQVLVQYDLQAGLCAMSDPGVADPSAILTLRVQAKLQRTGRAISLLVEGAANDAGPDRSLLRLLAQGQRFKVMLLTSQDQPITALAKQVGVSASYFTRILRLGFLAPQIVKTILAGRQPATLNAQRLSLDIKLPHAWQDQLAILTGSQPVPLESG